LVSEKPENLWGSERNEKSQEHIDDMSEDEDNLESAMSLLENILEM